MNGWFSRFGLSSHIAITAVFFVVALLAAGLWKVTSPQMPSILNVRLDSAQGAGLLATEASSSTENIDPISEASAGALIQLQGAYMGLRSQGAFDSQKAAQIATQIGQNLHAPVSYGGYGPGDVKTDSDTSSKRMLAYRKDLQASIAPLLENKDSEIRLLGLYAETKDPIYLDQLRAAAQNYLVAASSTAQLVVPADAANIHLGILNSMVEFAAVLDSVADHAQDPIAAVLLLQNYNQAESGMFSSFNALASYFKNKSS